MEPSPSDVPLGYHTACEDRGERITQHLISLLRMFEAFSLHCFRTGTPYFVDSGTLLGCVRHRGVIPWDNDIDVAMLTEHFGPFLDQFSEGASGLLLDRHAYGDPNGCVWFRDAASGKAGLDLSAYEPNGRSLMGVAIQREWPLDAWRSEHGGNSWTYDFPPGDLAEYVTLPSYCGPQRAPVRWRERLARHYDTLDSDLALREQAARELPFDPELPPVRTVKAYASIEEGLRATAAGEPFEVQNCKEFDTDTARLEHAIRGETKPLQAYHPSSKLRFDPVWVPGDVALARLRSGMLDVNIFDTPASLPRQALPLPFRRKNPGETRFPFDVGYLLSPARAETLFHSDGFVHTYNWLAEGEKYWWFVEPFAASQEWLAERSITDIITSDNFARWGRVHVLHQRAGSAVVFPGHWPHRVHSLSTCLGVAGYTHLQAGEFA